ncbi:MAG: hypothetical protein ACOCUA_02920 [archaeon]
MTRKGCPDVSYELCQQMREEYHERGYWARVIAERHDVAVGTVYRHVNDHCHHPHND